MEKPMNKIFMNLKKCIYQKEVIKNKMNLSVKQNKLHH